MATILEIIELLYLNERLSDSDEMWYTRVDLELNDSHVTKYEIFLYFKMADSYHIENLFFFGHNSAVDCLTSVKFCAGKQQGCAENQTLVRIWFLKPNRPKI